MYEIRKGNQETNNDSTYHIHKHDNTTTLQKKVDWTLESIHFHRGPSMYGITYQLIVYMLLSVNMFKDKIDKYLVKAGYT